MQQPDHDHNSMTPAEREFVEVLRAAVPAGPAPDPWVLAFGAGRRQGREESSRALGLWRAMACAALLALGVSVAMSFRTPQNVTSQPPSRVAATIVGDVEPESGLPAGPTSARLLSMPSAASVRPIQPTQLSVLSRLITIGVRP